MASTSVKLHNNSDTTIRAKLYWALSQIGRDVIIEPGKAGDLPCEYVWYDLYVYSNTTDKEICKSKGIYGHTTCECVKINNGYTIRRY